MRVCKYLTLVLILGVAAAGCTREPEPVKKPAPEKNGGAAEKSDDGDKATKDEEKSATTPSAQKPSAEKSSKVMLGSPELTAGIPGEGDLTVEEIKAWLDDPANHEVLEVELPMGLAAGASQIQGLDANPLTRAKIELGRQLYFDPRLSVDVTISCASCHHPDFGYAKDTRFGVGIKALEGNRNSPTAYNRILSGPQFWDGRAASLEEQAVGPIANPIEMGHSHEACVICLSEIEGYPIQFEKIFPGEGLTIENVAKAIASFERAIVTGTSPADHYEFVRGVEQQFGGEEDAKEELQENPDLLAKYEAALAGAAAMSESARRGRELFFTEKANCTACHVGANFSDEKYHNLGVGMDAETPDLGRFEVTKKEEDKGAFKTPTIRNVAQTAPYMHDGSQKTLEEVVEWYTKGGHPNPWLSKDIKKLDLSDQDKKDLVEYMKSLTGPLPEVETDRLPK